MYTHTYSSVYLCTYPYVCVGKSFRQFMYPGQGGGVLRLHASYRHDLKIKASDEGRVMKTAAAFTKGN